MAFILVSLSPNYKIFSTNDEILDDISPLPNIYNGVAA